MSDINGWSVRGYSTIAVPLCGVKMLCYDQSGFLNTDSKHKCRKKKKFFEKKEGKMGEGKESLLKVKQ